MKILKFFGKEIKENTETKEENKVDKKPNVDNSKSFAYITDLYSKTFKLHKETFGNYKNCNNGKTIVLVASGPTVKYFSPIKDALHCAVNGSFMHECVNFDYLFMQDYKAVKPYIENLELNNLKNTERFYGYFSPRVEEFTVPESIAIRHGAKRYYAHSLFWDKEKLFTPTYDFAHDLTTQPLICHGTVALTALQFLLWTNPKQIYLVGCDVSMGGHFNNKMGAQQIHISGLKVWHKGWEKFKKFAEEYYPETQIISINPVGLFGLFEDYYTENYIKANPEIQNEIEEIKFLSYE